MNPSWTANAEKERCVMAQMRRSSTGPPCFVSKKKRESFRKMCQSFKLDGLSNLHCWRPLQALDGLQVQPEAGSALVFCPSLADGSEDLRMVHSALTIMGPVEKWVVPLWSLQ
ncbi:unnamed protein product, partial [Durusdinium trenchii]